MWDVEGGNAKVVGSKQAWSQHDEDNDGDYNYDDGDDVDDGAQVVGMQTAQGVPGAIPAWTAEGKFQLGMETVNPVIFAPVAGWKKFAMVLAVRLQRL